MRYGVWRHERKRKRIVSPKGEAAIHTTSNTPRRSFVSLHPLPLALAGGALILGMVVTVHLAARPEPDTVARPVLVYDSTGTMLAAMGPSAGAAGSAAHRVPVYDATGAMLE